jgi:electron transfer flavoprotein beta subunit
MNILVITRAVIDNNTTPQINIDNSIDLQHAKLSINSYDERAIIEAVKYKNQHAPFAKIYICGIGSKSENIIRIGLARGGDEGIQIMQEDTDDDLTIAKYIKNATLENLISNPDIIFLGLESTNSNNNFLPTMLSKLFNFKNIFNINRIEYCENNVIALNAYGINYNISSQSVISVAHTVNTPSFLKLPEVMAAKKKSIHKISVMAAQDLNNEIIIEKAYYPENKRKCQYLNYDELLKLLKSVGEELQDE